ncbi:hypothetical protein EDD86DRAFT_276691 [Gorgonomyces haynaldii]|nr:hypothetical protein EDD86DRAFT_276691 [Gorgonomyces haynaldii]
MIGVGFVMFDAGFDYSSHPLFPLYMLTSVVSYCLDAFLNIAGACIFLYRIGSALGLNNWQLVSEIISHHKGPRYMIHWAQLLPCLLHGI